MALIRHFRALGAADRGRVHGEVDCGYATFVHQGTRYLQLDTYGSGERLFPGKVSQSIQLDENGARRLKELLTRTFGDI